MTSSYIFSGMGHSSGKFQISNEYIADAIRKGFLRGFDENRMAKSQNYIAYKETHPNIGPFDYFVREKMGFNTRWHVTPFPPTRKKLNYAETSLELGVRAADMALKNAGVTPKEIDAWFVSTVSPHQKAPGIAAAIKSHFVPFDNYSAAFTLTSGCAGFNINLERAIEYFMAHPEAKNVLVGHAETMSSFLTQRVKFVPFVTFADGAAFVVLSKVETETQQGVLHVNNYQDMHMVDFVGVDKKWNLYMDDSLIKDRAINNIPEASIEMLARSNWGIKDIDLCVPHQTGNAILLDAAKKLRLDASKVYLEAQKEYGNISGATVPIAYSMLNQAGKLKPGMKILSPMAGVGGNYGAFTYVVPDKELTARAESALFTGDLLNKNALVLGASGTLGYEITRELILRGANILAHYNRSNDKIAELELLAKKHKVSFTKFQADFYDEQQLADFADKLLCNGLKINYFVNAAGVLMSRKSGKVQRVNFKAPLKLFKKIFNCLQGSALFVGAAAEDVNVPEIQEFISAKRSLHGTLSSMSGEMLKNRNYLLWYMPGVLEGGMLRNIDQKNLYRFMVEIGQDEALDVKKTAFKIVNSLYIPKVEGTNHNYENAMVVRRDGYQLEVDI